MIKWSNLSWRLGKWAESFKPFYNNGGFDVIYDFLKAESVAGKRITPDSGDVYKAFMHTPPNEVKCVIMGLCPYHTKGVADGLALSCSKTMALQPSLEKVYEAWEEEFNEGLCLQCKKEPDLSYLARQGVLLLNAALTTEVGIAKAHQKIWKPFISYTMELISKNVPVIFLGNEASEFGRYIENEECKFFLKHPAWASYKKCKWDSEGAFGKVNILLKNDGIQQIDWTNEAPF